MVASATLAGPMLEVRDRGAIASQAERRAAHADRLRAAEARAEWGSGASLGENLRRWSAHFYASPSVPESLVLIAADGTRRVLDRAVPAWILPAICVLFGIGWFAFVDGSPLDRAFGPVVGLAFAPLFFLRARLAERHLVVDAPRGLLVVEQGGRVVVEIPFADIERIYVEVTANPGYADNHRAFAQVGAARVMLTGVITTATDAAETASAVAACAGVALDPEPRRRIPE